MNIGIIGSGNVGGTLGRRWAALGHKVIFSSRNPTSDAMRQLVRDAGPNASPASVAEAVNASDLLLLATPWNTTRQAVEAAGDLSGKVVIDATNPLHADLSGLELGTDISGAESIAKWASGASVVKAFNTVGAPVMANAVFNGRGATLFYCGDDAAAKKAVHQLAVELGFDARDAGPLRQARLLEPFALLWISLAFNQRYGFEFGFSILTRS
jgi:8-hydroxy-5-deazaflavin:NADPH oxidoreductase